jgi:pimeloyl-ACP methyl ester carboxylesterase
MATYRSPRSAIHHVLARDGTRIAWHSHGRPSDTGVREGRPSIILTNGLGSTPNFWNPLASRLVESHHVVDWDYRGHGDSDVPANRDFATTTHADDLERVTLAAEAARGGAISRGPPIHIGFSMGVTVVLELYRRRPELVRAMVLIAGGADHPYAAHPVFQLPGFRAAVRAGLHALAPVMPRLTPLTRSLSRSKALFSLAQMMGVLSADAPRDDLEQFFRQVGAMDMRAYWGAVRALLEAHASDVLPGVRVPVLIVAAESDVLAPAGDMDLLRRWIPGAQWARIPGTGHAVLLEAGRAVGDRVERFLGELGST